MSPAQPVSNPNSLLQLPNQTESFRRAQSDSMLHTSVAKNNQSGGGNMMSPTMGNNLLLPGNYHQPTQNVLHQQQQQMYQQQHIQQTHQYQQQFVYSQQPNNYSPTGYHYQQTGQLDLSLNNKNLPLTPPGSSTTTSNAASSPTNGSNYLGQKFKNVIKILVYFYDLN